MRRWPLFLLLATAATTATAEAAMPRVALETPLTPPTAFSSAFAPFAPSAITASAAPLFFSPAPALPAASVLASPAALSAPTVAALPIPADAAAPRSAAASSEPAGPKAIDALRANAPLADKLSAPAPGVSPESSAQELENNFNAAASLGSNGSEAAKAAETARGPLLARLLQRVRLDDGGVPERRAALARAFERMLQAPTARSLAERFIADGVPAVVRFGEFQGSRIHVVDGRKVFHANYGSTDWKADRVEVTMNQDYLGVDAEIRHQELPVYLAHELFGHGLWLPRASREDVLPAFHHHDLHELYARLVQWLVDFELDRRFEGSDAWSYLRDPADYLARLKLRHSSYATTWSTAELARPRETLEERSMAARTRRERARTELANHSSWNAVIDHFASHHAVSESRLRALRAFMAERAQVFDFDIGVLDAVIVEIDALVGRMNAEPDRASERYLREVAAHPFFADLQRQTDESSRLLLELVSRAPAKPGDESEAAARAREEHWRGQITFERLVEMYREDRERNPKHWRS